MWDIKYRPKKFSDVLGQPGNVKLLKARLRNGTAYDTSYIFLGGHGQGKTTLARIHARAMLCQALNKEDPEPCNECDNCQAILIDQSNAFTERDAASNGGVDSIRQIVDTLGFAMINARMRIELFDEAHRMSTAGQDVLLKPLEEKRLVGMFCTTEPEKIRGTIRARCEEYEIRKVTREDILERTRNVCKQENVTFEEDALLTIIDSSGGHIRDVLNKMEMISQIGDINLANTRDYLHLDAVSLYYDILLSLSEPKKAIEFIHTACERVNPDEILGGLAEAAMNSYRLANGMYTEFSYVDRSKAKEVYDRYQEGTVVLADYFLQNRYPTRAGLFRDILSLSRQPNQLPPDSDQRLLVVLQLGAAGPVLQAPVLAQAVSSPPVIAPVKAHTNGVSPVVVPVALVVPHNSPVLVPHVPNSVVGESMVRTGEQRPLARGVSQPNWHTNYEPRADEQKPLTPMEWGNLFKKKWRGCV